MAKRTNDPFHDARTREKIQTSQLINRLNDYANGKITLESSQVKAIEILLRKTLPDLSSTTADTDRHNFFDQRVNEIDNEG
jgi:hypothetical protein